MEKKLDTIIIGVLIMMCGWFGVSMIEQGVIKGLSNTFNFLSLLVGIFVLIVGIGLIFLARE